MTKNNERPLCIFCLTWGLVIGLVVGLFGGYIATSSAKNPEVTQLQDAICAQQFGDEYKAYFKYWDTTTSFHCTLPYSANEIDKTGVKVSRYTK